MKAMNDVVKLKTENGTIRDRDGFKVKAYLETECFCAINSVRGSEVYDAMRNGIKLVFVVALNVDDYKSAYTTVDGKTKKPSRVEYEGEEFQIIRTYQTNDKMIELSIAEVE